MIHKSNYLICNYILSTTHNLKYMANIYHIKHFGILRFKYIYVYMITGFLHKISG